MQKRADSRSEERRMECWCEGVMYKNRKRGYQQLRVWQDAVEFYTMNCEVLRDFPYELKRIASQQISPADCERLDKLALRPENGLLKLVESLESKRETGPWIDHLVIKECNEAYGRVETEEEWSSQHSITPQLQHSRGSS
jgi:hypothetical protein